MEIEVKNYDDYEILKKKELNKSYLIIGLITVLLIFLKTYPLFKNINDSEIMQAFCIFCVLMIVLSLLICLISYLHISDNYKLTEQYVLRKIESINCKEINCNGLTTLFVTYNDSKTENFYVNCKINPEIKQPYYDGKRNLLIVHLYQK